MRLGVMRWAILPVSLTLWLVAGCGTGSKSVEARGHSAMPGLTAAAPSPAPQADDALPPEKTGGFDGRRAFAHVARLVQMGPRQSGTSGIVQAQEYILSELKNYGCTVEADDFHSDTPVGSLGMKNIVVKIPGERPEIVLLAGHYDTKRLENFAGADDGGSSTAVMLELARVLCGK